MTEKMKTHEIPDAVLEELLKDDEKPEDLLGPDGIFKALKKRMIEKALGAELTGHLGYGKSDPAGRGSGNSRNGASKKTLASEDGATAFSPAPSPGSIWGLAHSSRVLRCKKDRQPDFRIYTEDRVEIGGGWNKVGRRSGRPYVSLIFAYPNIGRSKLYANLGRAAGQDDEDVFAILWNPED